MKPLTDTQTEWFVCIQNWCKKTQTEWFLPFELPDSLGENILKIGICVVLNKRGRLRKRSIGAISQEYSIHPRFIQ